MSNDSLLLTRYEVAQEILGLMMALRSHEAQRERERPAPNLSRVAALEAEQSQFAADIQELMPDDYHAVDRILSLYGPQVREQLSHHGQPASN